MLATAALLAVLAQPHEVQALGTAAARGETGIKNEHVTFSGPRPGMTTHRLVNQEPIMSAALRPRAAQAATAAVPSIGFLTRPYPTWHDITSIFDHCNPDYTTDGKVCRFDGSIGYASYGVDPSFSRGYAQTPRGTDYLYYDGHNGWDYALSYENVLASADGTVRLSGIDSINPCFGQNVILDHPNGYSTRYAHLSSIYVSPGQNIARGQVIGQSGNTGCSTGPHLHFGVYITNSWTAVDPWGYSGSGTDPWPSDPGNLWLTGYAQFPIPGEPTNVSAIAGNGSAAVSWTAPTFDGGTGIVNYTVTSAPGGLTATAPGTATSATVTGLVKNTSYTFTVTANGTVRAGPVSAASNSVIWISSTVAGYSMAGNDGGIYPQGQCLAFGSLGGQHLNAPIVGMATTRSGAGYWMVASDGGIFTFGDAQFFGSTGGMRLNQPVVGMAATADGKGYWLVAADGGVFTFGDAQFFGSTGGIRLTQPAVGLAPTATGKGYWIVAADGGIFTFGDATFSGSLGGQHLNAPIRSMAGTQAGDGYWLAASDGGVFTFGGAHFYGSLGGHPLTAPVVGMTVTPDGGGYWMVARDGGVFTFGDAQFFGSISGHVSAPVVALALC